MTRLTDKEKVLIPNYPCPQAVLSFRIGKERYIDKEVGDYAYRHGIRAVLQCGHKIFCEGLSEPPTSNIIECYLCATEEVKKFVANNPRWMTDKQRAKFHKDGRPKPRFRSKEGEVKFLKRLARQRGEA